MLLTHSPLLRAATSAQSTNFKSYFSHYLLYLRSPRFHLCLQRFHPSADAVALLLSFCHLLPGELRRIQTRVQRLGEMFPSAARFFQTICDKIRYVYVGHCFPLLLSTPCSPYAAIICSYICMHVVSVEDMEPTERWQRSFLSSACACFFQSESSGVNRRSQCAGGM